MSSLDRPRGPVAEQIMQTVNRYLELVGNGQADDIAELYSDDATVEDPVGGEVHIGRAAIRGFYSSVENVKAQTEVLTLRASAARRRSTGRSQSISATMGCESTSSR